MNGTMENLKPDLCILLSGGYINGQYKCIINTETEYLWPIKIGIKTKAKPKFL